MDLRALAPLQRKARQRDTLRKMLDQVNQLAGLVEQLTRDRELTASEQDELAALAVRRERIEKSLSEAGG